GSDVGGDDEFDVADGGGQVLDGDRHLGQVFGLGEHRVGIVQLEEGDALTEEVGHELQDEVEHPEADVEQVAEPLRDVVGNVEQRAEQVRDRADGGQDEVVQRALRQQLADRVGKRLLEQIADRVGEV